MAEASQRTGAIRVRAERSDSVANRHALLMAAQHVMSREGLEVPLDRVAERAGLSIATLYRHFPSREELWQAVLREPLTVMSELFDRCLADPDPWNGFSAYLWGTCALEADADGYVNLMNTRFDGAPDLKELRGLLQEKTSRILERARAAGAVRADLTMEDLAFIALSNSRIVELTRGIAPTAWKRNLELFVSSVRLVDAPALVEPPMTPLQVMRMMKNLRGPGVQSRRGRPPRSPAEG